MQFRVLSRHSRGEKIGYAVTSALVILAAFVALSRHGGFFIPLILLLLLVWRVRANETAHVRRALLDRLEAGPDDE